MFSSQTCWFTKRIPHGLINWISDLQLVPSRRENKNWMEIEGKTVSSIFLGAAVNRHLTLAFNTQRVKASGTVYVRAYGSVGFPSAPIQWTMDINRRFLTNEHRNFSHK